jgi:hypothetical protein
MAAHEKSREGVTLRGSGVRSFRRICMLKAIRCIGRDPSAKPWVDGTFHRPERTPSVRPTAETSFRGAAAVPESYRINEFETTGAGVRCGRGNGPDRPGQPFPNRWIVDVSPTLTSF